MKEEREAINSKREGTTCSCERQPLLTFDQKHLISLFHFLYSKFIISSSRIYFLEIERQQCMELEPFGSLNPLGLADSVFSTKTAGPQPQLLLPLLNMKRTF